MVENLQSFQFPITEWSSPPRVPFPTLPPPPALSTFHISKKNWFFIFSTLPPSLFLLQFYFLFCFTPSYLLFCYKILVENLLSFLFRITEWSSPRRVPFSTPPPPSLTSLLLRWAASLRLACAASVTALFLLK